MGDPVTWEALAAALGLLAGGGGVAGTLKLVDLRRRKNGNSYVTEKWCLERKKVVNDSLDELKQGVTRIENILLKGSPE